MDVMKIMKIAQKIMAEYENTHGGFGHFSCDCGMDEFGAAYTHVGVMEDTYDKLRRIHALARIIEHAEYGHATPSSVLFHPAPVAVNIFKADR